MKTFDKYYNIIMQQLNPNRVTMFYDQDGNQYTSDQLKKDFQQLKANNETEAQTYQEYIDNATSKNGTLTQITDRYVEDDLAKKLNMSYQTWKDAQEIIYLYQESTDWGGRQESHTAYPQRKIDEILNNYYTTTQYQGNILGGPKPIEYLQIAIYTESNGAIVAFFPNKNNPNDQKVINDMLKSLNDSDQQKLLKLLNFWDNN